MTLAPYYILISNLLMVTAQVKTKQAIETINTTQPVAPQSHLLSLFLSMYVAQQHKTVDVDDFFCWCTGLTTGCIRGILIKIIKMARTCLKSNRNISIYLMKIKQ